MISAIVLAAGESKRMGPDNKLLLPFEGRPMIAHVAATALASRAFEVIVVAGHQEQLLRSALEALDITIVVNPRFKEGMTTSIQAGVEAASLEATGIMICLGDLPMLRASDLDQVMDAFRSALVRDVAAIVRPTYQGAIGHPVILAAHYRSQILAHEKIVGCRGVIRRHPDHVSHIEMETDYGIRDIDTREAYQATGAVL